MVPRLPPSGEAGPDLDWDQYQPLAEINVTPMVDVMLVLLIIFMVTAPLLAGRVYQGGGGRRGTQPPGGRPVGGGLRPPVGRRDRGAGLLCRPPPLVGGRVGAVCPGAGPKPRDKNLGGPPPASRPAATAGS